MSDNSDIMIRMIYSYDPVVAPDARTLILGTAPSVKSLEQGFYYAHPRNAFWPMLALILGRERPGSIDEKRNLILTSRLALWDVTRCCLREGSLDSSIREAEPNDVAGLLAAHPSIDRVLLNGKTAQALYFRWFKDTARVEDVRVMPSTSPAYTLPFDGKRAAWAEGLSRDD